MKLKNKVSPSEDQAPMMDKNETNSNPSTSFTSTSIKCCMITMVSGLLFLSVLILSGIWLASFSPTVVSLSSTVRDEEFTTIVKYSQQTLKEVSVLNEAIKQQLATDDYSYGNFDYLENVMYAGYKSSQKHLKGITVSCYVGDTSKTCLGVIEWGAYLASFNVTSTAQLIYYCDNITNHEQCIRNTKPDETNKPFDLSYLVEVCDANPGQQVFTLSYADISMPQYIFITSMNCVINKKLPLPSGHNFHYYQANDLTVTSISDFLKEKTASISGSVGFIVETETAYLIAVDREEVVFSDWQSDGSLIRKTPSDVSDSKINTISQGILSQYSNDWSKITCNEMKVFEQGGQYISLYRLCTSSKIDWVLVLSVPQWNYIGSTIIAIICSLIGSVIIISVGLLLGVMVSLKVVKPFYNLIELFESVANMDLDQLQVIPSSFSEVKQLQGHFISMVNRIKLYKSFIPAHLLSEIENADGNNQEQGSDTESSFRKQSRGKVYGESNLSSHETQSMGSSESSKGGSHHKMKSSRKKVYKNDRSKFSLYMEQKKVTFVQIHFCGFTEWLQNMNPNETIELMSDIFEQINNVSRTSSGNVGNFENESITISFNSSNNQKNHEEKGVVAASTLLNKLATVKYTKWKNNELLKKNPQLLDLMSFRISVLTQNSYCGNIGTNELKNFTIISSAKHNLDELAQLAIELNVSIVVSEHIKEKCEQLFQMRYIDTKDFLHETNLNSLVGKSDDYKTPMNGTSTNIYELGNSLKVAEDEWMYELQEKNKQSQWQDYQQASKFFLQQDYKQAHSLLQNFYQQNPQDGPTLHLLRLCESKM